MSPFQSTSVLVIGGLGFIGSNLTRRLVSLGARVAVLTPSRERHITLVDELEAAGVVVTEGDLRDHGLVSRVVAGHGLVFNLSGQSGAIRSMEDPWTDLDVNCRGTLVLLDALRHVNPAAKLVAAGSRLEYGRPASLPADELAMGEPLSVHAIHKRTVEQYLRLYRRLFGLRFAIARVTNPYGPGQPAGRTAYGIINRLIQLALAGETLTLYGDGRQLRDYIHVDDVVSALLALAALGLLINERAGIAGCGRRRVQRGQRHRDVDGRRRRDVDRDRRCRARGPRGMAAAGGADRGRRLRRRRVTHQA